MNKLSIRIIFDKNGEAKKDSKKQAPVYIEVLELPSKRKRYIPTGVKILASQYSSNGGFSIKNHANAIIQKALGHSNIRQTLEYAKLLKSTVIESVISIVNRNNQTIEI